MGPSYLPIGSIVDLQGYWASIDLATHNSGFVHSQPSKGQHLLTSTHETLIRPQVCSSAQYQISVVMVKRIFSFTRILQLFYWYCDYDC